jgi:VWFA-related protein
MTRLAYSLGTAALIVALRLQAPAPASQPVLRVGTDIVQVDVSVLDHKRNPVTGLTAADFTVLEDGHPRPVTVFIPVEIPERESTSALAPWVRDVSSDVVTNDVRPEGRLVVIMLDWSIRFEDQQLARRIAATALDQLGPGDLAAVVFTSPVATAGTPQNFTSDRARLLAAINRPFAAAMHNPPVTGADPRNKNGVMLDDPEGYESGDCYCRVCVLEAITRVADAVRDVQGRRKTLLFIGEYFRSYESLAGPDSLLEFAPRFIAPVGAATRRPGTCAASLKDARTKMIRATSLANLTVHALDPVGLETPRNSPLGGTPRGVLERQEGLSELAASTGGRTVMNTNAPEEHVAAVFAESHSYYLLGFAPADPKANGRFHKVEVKVNRRGVSVRTRAGYYAGETRVAGLAPTVVSPASTAALDGILPRTDVPLRVGVAPFAVPGKVESAVAVVLNVLPQNPPDGSAPIKVVAAAFDRDGRSVQAEEQTVAVASRPHAGRGSPYEVVSRLALAPGRYEIRVALDAGPAQRASVFTYVDVPDFAQQPLSLSGIVLAATPSVPSAPRDAFTNLLPLMPTAQRTFAPTDRATVFLRVYQDAKATVKPATVTARITDAADRVVFDQAAPLTADLFTATHGADYRLELPLERLASGEYLLTIDAAQDGRVARRGVRFTVRQP